MKFWKRLKNIKLITVGTKVLFGVSLATNIFIGALVYVNFQSTRMIEKTVDQVLSIRETLSGNLRATVVELQNELLALPSFFKSNPQKAIADKLEATYPVKKKPYRDAPLTKISSPEERDGI